MRPVARFLLLCMCYWALALWILSHVPAVEEAGVRFTVATVQGAMALAGQQVVRAGQTLLVGGLGVEIVGDCSPHVPLLLFAGAVLAFPATWRERLLGLGVGVVALPLFNTLRIVALMAVLVTRRSWFEFVHIYLWQTGTLLVLFGTFGLWLGMLRRAARAS